MTHGPASGAAVIGLEVHVQLRTRTKLFCACSAEYGARPNSRVCETCLGLPGTLPVLNGRAVDLATRTALALGFTVHDVSLFVRKHYFYPDLPRGFQITQHERPLATDGALRFRLGDDVHTVRLTRLHLEEDSARLLHEALDGATAVDFNRAGVALIEVVTAPELQSPRAARAFLAELKRTLRHLEVSDCAMEEGSLRVDANVSIVGLDGRAGERSEVKNLNSFAGVERALHFEIERQRTALAAGNAPGPETRGWDAGAGVTRPLRGKEDAEDYRYLAEPDLPPLLVPHGVREHARGALPELPLARAARLIAAHGLPTRQADALVADRATADRFEALVRDGVSGSLAASWLLGEERAAAAGRQPSPVPPLASLLRALESGEITRHQARSIAATLDRGDAQAPDPIGSTVRVSDEDTIERWGKQVLRAHAGEVERYRKGEGRLLDFFIGGVMRLSRGSADPVTAAAVLRRLLERTGT